MAVTFPITRYTSTENATGSVNTGRLMENNSASGWAAIFDQLDAISERGPSAGKDCAGQLLGSDDLHNVKAGNRPSCHPGRCSGDHSNEENLRDTRYRIHQFCSLDKAFQQLAG